MSKFNTSFDFGANAKPKKPKKRKSSGKKSGKGDAWKAYTGDAK